MYMHQFQVCNINGVVRNVVKSYGERWVRAFIQDGVVAPQHGPIVVFRCLSRNNHNFTTAGVAKGGRRKFTFHFPEGWSKRGSLRVDRRHIFLSRNYWGTVFISTVKYPHNEFVNYINGIYCGHWFMDDHSCCSWWVIWITNWHWLYSNVSLPN